MNTTTTIINKAYICVRENEIICQSPEAEHVVTDKSGLKNDDGDNDGVNEKQIRHLDKVLESTAKKIEVIAKCRRDAMGNDVYEAITRGEINLDRIPRYVSENVCIVTMVWQLVCALGLEAIDGITRGQLNRKGKWYFVVGIVVIAIFQLFNIILCLLVARKLFTQYKQKRTPLKYLVYCYIAILFLFGGMYTFIAWGFPSVFDGVRYTSQPNISTTMELYTQLTLMSISTGTLCGSTRVTASHVITEWIMSFQMLLSLLYVAPILSEMTDAFKSRSKPEREFRGELSEGDFYSPLGNRYLIDTVA